MEASLVLLISHELLCADQDVVLKAALVQKSLMISNDRRY